ncbi:hypothetical protein FN846DRAFT_943414 [Sphaerosporella brunnea]|uniref:Uncharacterized protein n=1 Tax=Sphaerosporella brunnea TaxID=1250544 RepID=A0A5J5F007_9PEZI|nr:hypothetical protein FN846DRAFT_943414 [Sphaerosporella brunnea]
MGKKRTTVPTTTTTAETTRLHITPLTAATASSILPAGTDLATVSYHELPTFPEHSYGFVDLPAAAAEKLKKKLHGAMFRGVKVRVEEARPETWVKERDEEPKEERRERRREKKRKREDGVLEGMQLDEERRIARGWVDKEKKERKEAKDKDGKKSKKEKKKADRSECLFKAAIPPNKLDLVKEKPKKEKKSKEEKALEKAKKKDKKTRKVIREFEKLEKFPAFLKSSQLDPTRTPSDLVGGFVEGVGWVDGKGAVVEEPPKKKHKKDRKKDKVVQEAPKGSTPVSEVAEQPKVVDFDDEKEPEPAPAHDDMDIDDAASVSSEEVFFDVPDTAAEDTLVVDASADEESDEESQAEAKTAETKQASSTPIEENDASSESGSGSEAESSSEDEEDEEEKEEEKAIATKAKVSSPIPSQKDEDCSDSSSSDEEEPIKSSPSKEKPSLAPLNTKVHPLEALYKPSAAETMAEAASGGTFKFGFGSGDSEDEDEDDGPALVRTPYREPGGYRSSAPTPDTAIGTKRFFSPTASEEGESFAAAPVVAPFLGAVDAPLLFNHEESRFLKGMSLWQKIPRPKALLPGEQEAAGTEAVTDPVELWKKRFYENRGEWNREFKRRRKEGLKAKRKRERTGPSGANRV